MSVLVQSGKTASAVGRMFTPLPQLLKNVRFTGNPPLDENGVQSAVADAEARLGQDGRLLIRESGTEPLIRVMAEGPDEALIEDVINDIVDAIERAAA